MSSFSFIIGPGPKLPDGYIIKEYVMNHEPHVQAHGHVSMVCQLIDGRSFLFHISGYEQMGQGEFMCLVRTSNPLYSFIQENAMVSLDGVYNGILLDNIQPIQGGI
jgi:hypothetical protein